MTRSKPWGAKPFCPATLVALLFACAALALAAPAAAQDRAQARALFDEGKALLKNGNAAAACPKFETALKIDVKASALYMLASCYETAGKTASAWEHFKRAAAAFQTEGKKERAGETAGDVERLAAKLTRLKIVVSPAAAQLPGLVVTRDGQPIASTSFGVAVPVDPGPHELSATATGKQAHKNTIDVVGEGATREVEIPVLKDVPVEPTAATTPAPLPSKAEPARGPVKASSGARTAGWVIGGAGLAATITGGVLVGVAKSKYSNADCGDDACRTLSGRDATQSARSMANVGGIVFTVGVVALGTGAVLVLVSGKSHTAEIAVGITPAGLDVAGRF
jgi:hypothetical protein